MGPLTEAAITSPKRTAHDGSAWYDYYAGYSLDFTRDVLDLLAPSQNAPMQVLDPWNGSGTTTAVAAKLGHKTTGIDRNPALVVIAKGRHLVLSSVTQSLDPLRSEIVVAAKSLTRRVRAKHSDSDELRQWFTPTAAARIRALERAIYRVLVNDDVPIIPTEPINPKALSPLASFFYSTLFTVTRRLTASFRTTNPTWVRGAETEQDCIEVSWDALEKMLASSARTLEQRLTLRSSTSARFSLQEGSAEEMNLTEQADVVLTSPPYCTRIDYIVATLPELAVLAHDADDIKHLRQQMLGTPLTRGIEPEVATNWGLTAATFMRSVYSHPSKAASTYYYRYYAGYLRGLYNSMLSIDRNTKPDGVIGLVVQDSYFKDVQFDLPQILTEMGEGLKRDCERINFHVPRTKAAIHPGSRQYRKVFDATESLLLFRAKED